jgi:predicted amidohydrolase
VIREQVHDLPSSPIQQPVDPAANFAAAEAYIRDAASQGCQIAQLPEYHLTSWAPEHADFISSTKESVTYLSRYQDLARELNINIVPGTICEVHPLSDENQNSDSSVPGIELRNMAYFIAAGSGTILSTYQKKNLWHPERPHLTGSAHQPHAAFDIPTLPRLDPSRPVRAGMLVCWDIAFPEAFRALVADGADIIFVPSFWYMSDVDEEARRHNPDSEKAFLESALVARAYENTAAVVFVNAGGLSQVAMPILGAVGRMGTAEEEKARGKGAGQEMRVVEVDMDVLRIAEGNYKVREDMRKEGWHYGYTLRKTG